jgi:hypothetical protein
MAISAMLPLTDIVGIEDVDLREAQALQTVLERAHDSVIGIVIDRIERHRTSEPWIQRRIWTRTQQTANLCRQHPLIAGHFSQRISDDAACLTKAVKRRGIEIADAGRPSRTHNLFRDRAGNRDAMTAKRPCSEPENRHSEARTPQRARLEAHHTASPPQLSVDIISVLDDLLSVCGAQFRLSKWPRP